MFIIRKSLSRRTVLRGLGAALSLPVLDAMVPALTALAASPARALRRLGFVYIPNGANMADWVPAAEGPRRRVLAHSGATRVVPRPRARTERADQPGPGRPRRRGGVVADRRGAQRVADEG